MDLKKHVRQIPDFPKPGINFFDISTLIGHPVAWRTAVERMVDLVKPWQPDFLAAIDARGFIIGAPLAYELGCSFVPVRKKGKLPGKTVGLDYALEYGTDRVEVQEDAIQPGQRVVVVDDLLATGGTLAAAIALLRKVGGVVPAAATLIELSFLGGRAKLPNESVHSVLQY